MTNRLHFKKVWFIVSSLFLATSLTDFVAAMKRAYSDVSEESPMKSPSKRRRIDNASPGTSKSPAKADRSPAKLEKLSGFEDEDIWSDIHFSPEKCGVTLSPAQLFEQVDQQVDHQKRDKHVQRSVSKEPKRVRPLGQVALERELDPLTHSALSPDGKFIATGGTDGLVYLWDTTDGTSQIVLDAELNQPIDCIKWAQSCDGSSYVVAAFGEQEEAEGSQEDYQGPKIVFWKKTNSIPDNYHDLDLGDQVVTNVALLPDSLVLAYTTTEAMKLLVFDQQDFEHARELALAQNIPELSEEFKCLAVNKNYCISLMQGDDQIVCKVFDFELKELLSIGLGPDTRCIACDISPCNEILLLTCQPTGPTSIKRYFLQENEGTFCVKELSSLACDGLFLKSLNYSSDNIFVIGTANLQQPTKQTARRRLFDDAGQDCKPATVFVWSRTGELLARVHVSHTLDGFKIHDAKICDGVLMLFLSKETSFWVVSVRVPHAFTTLQGRELGQRRSIITGNSMSLELDEHGQIWVNYL